MKSVGLEPIYKGVGCVYVEGFVEEFEKERNKKPELEEFEKEEKEVLTEGMIGIDELVGVVVAFVVIAMVAGFGAMLLSKLKNSTTDTDAQTAISNASGAITTVTSYLDIVALAVVIGVVLTVVLVYLYRRFG